MKYLSKFRDIGFASLIFLIVSFLFWGRYLFLHQAFFYDTFFKNFFPDAVLFKASLLAKEWPFWNPYMYSGVPFLANTEPSVFYPATLLQVFLSYPIYALVTTWIHAFLAGIFMFVLARKMGLSYLGAVLSGLVYSFNGFYVDHYAYTHIFQGYAWLPFIVWAFCKSLEPRKLFFLIFAAFGLAFQILSGHPQYVFYSCLILLSYSIWLYFKYSPSAKTTMAPFFILAAIISLAILISAIQLVPTLLFAAESPRRLGSGYEWSTIYSLNPRELIRMLLFPLWNRYWIPVSGDPNVVGFYIGWMILMLSGVALMKRKVLASGHFYVLCAIAGLGLLLPLGKYLPGYHLLYDFLFPFRIFRFPAQALYMACFAMSLMAGTGLDVLQTESRAKILLIILCVLDLWIFSFKAVKTIDPIFYQTQPKVIHFLKEKDPLARFFLTPKTRAVSWRTGKTELEAAVQYIDTLYPNLGMAYGLYDADGLQELRYAKYEQVLNEISSNPLSPWMDVLGIRYIFSFWNNMPDKFKLIQSKPFYIYENKTAFPKAYLVPNAIKVPLEETISYVHDHPTLNLRDVVIVDSLENNPEQNKLPLKLQNDVQVKEYHPNRILVEAQSNFSGWLVLSDAYDKGWTARLNGIKVPLYRANGIFRSIQLPAGFSKVEYIYRPKFFDVGKFISIAVVIVCVFFLLFTWLTEKNL